MLIPRMPRAGHGLLTGVYSMSRGVGIVLGGLLLASVPLLREMTTTKAPR